MTCPSPFRSTCAIICSAMAVTVADPKYDTVEPRFIAGLADGLVLMPIIFADMLIFPLQIAWLSIAWILISLSLCWIYSVVGHALYGKTVGKHLMKIIVLDDRTEGGISWRQAVLRDIFLIVVNTIAIFLNIYLVAWNITEFSPTLEVLSSVITYGPIFWFVTEVVTALMSDKRRALHDLIAGTVVVKIDQ